jgi:hypothetical protein
VLQLPRVAAAVKNEPSRKSFELLQVRRYNTTLGCTMTSGITS